jgi:pimeloyl-ACP methyl ester carboxylesterase
VRIAETDRFGLYQVLPRNQIALHTDAKPILIIPPYVLGANILAFLPGENKSYVHAYADRGIPTYIRIVKDIDTSVAVQTITGEEDALDLRYFCEQISRRHGRQVTLNGFCQGGFIALAAILSGELDELVDALITCVAPMDGSRSKALIQYMQHLPPRFRDLGYAVKILSNGNRVVDGKVMSWVYKLKSMETESPLYSFYRDLMMLEGGADGRIEISKTAAAINHWLLYDRSDLPEPITKMSFDSYTIPVRSDGTLPIRLFGRRLSFKRLADKKMPFLICYGRDDDLVDKEAALAPLDFVPAEVTCFPKGHGAIATSWSHPDSQYALHKRFADGSRGPVRFQLELSGE